MDNKTSMTKKILRGMLLGLVLGSLINTFASEVVWVQDYLVMGLFHVLGAAFISMLKMLVVPLVTFSLICGVVGIGDIGKLGRVGGKAFGYYMLTTALAITLAITLASFFAPGAGFELVGAASSSFVAPEAPPFTQVLIDLIPSNPVAAYAEGNMLQIIFFTILFASCMLMVGKAAQPLMDLAEIMNKVMMQVVNVVMFLAPLGVFALMAKTFAQQGVDLIIPMLGYFGVLVLALLLHMTGTLMLLLRIFGKVSPITFMKKMGTAQVFAFSTSSSNATIPVTLHTVEKRLGVNKSIASFTVPFGATINMDGTAIMQGVATVFIANVYGIDMPATHELIAHGKTVEQIQNEIGADWLVYQDLDDLISAAREGNKGIKQFDTSVFTGEYVTNDISKEYLDSLEASRNDSAKESGSTDVSSGDDEVMDLHNNN